MLHEIPVVFRALGTALAGTFYRRHDDLSVREKCVVVTGSWLNVKEQMASGYARALAERGFTTFTFDFGGWGQSQGEPRCAELPHAKVRELTAAAEYVATMSFVGPHVGYLGICASAQYGLRAVAEGARYASYASIAGWFHDASSIAGFYGGADGVRLRLERARDAALAFARTGEQRLVPAYAPGDDRAGMHFELDYYANRERGAVPAWRNEMAELSWLPWLAYDGISAAASVRVPTLMVHGDACALPDNARRVHDQLRGDKSLAWLSGGQTDFYDQPHAMEEAVVRAVDFFGRTL